MIFNSEKDKLRSKTQKSGFHLSFLNCFSSTTDLHEIDVSAGVFTDMGSLPITEYFS